MSKKLKKRLKRIVTGALLYLVAVLSSHFIPNLSGTVELVLFLIAYFVMGGNIVKAAVKNIGHGQIFDENFLMTIATVGAFLIGEYPEAVAVMLFYQVGEWFQSYAVGRSRKSIAELMDIRPDYANVLRDGEEREVSPDEVAIGEHIVVKPGERIPLDGTVVKGASSLDTMALTGESVPRDVATGEEVISGCVNLSGVLEVKVNKVFGESTVAKILELVENAGSKKSEAEHFITKFARYYTPMVVICAALLAVLPPLFIGGEWSVWIYRALSFLVISCPCALVISIPLSFFGGLGGASRAGILIKGSNYLEALADAEIVVMDKTGTLTKGTFVVTKRVPVKGVSEAALLEAAAYAESYSNHPISQSLLEAYGKEVDKSLLSDVEEVAGYGVRAAWKGSFIYAGNAKWMEQQEVQPEVTEEVGTIVHVAKGKEYLGYLVIADEIKTDAKKAIDRLKEAGMKHIVMLTGDRKKTADSVAKELGIEEVYSDLLPKDKVDQVERLFTEKSAKGKLIFVGDGINDAPVLARADIGMAMGGLGSDAAIEAADVVIMTDEPSKIAKAIQISQRTLVIVKQNIIFAIGVKILILLLAAVGSATMWAAVFGDVGVAVIAILNAMRAMNIKAK
ncbi:heavy metal translocating P-type ATPase [Kineothrix sp. MB12-C1]|uniref:heavy metal translocating P-type ATPase n=1 Tax=Kineothrix sp. MB12-C1 TaxID=3070215 RepID=UPI0027D2ABE7|nr:heavy metal translocating P-type ATPase [Kineothrix sp. MB12-C1]WMC93537.1 heavy metal translocating P-type ATPase [Kineothrix sp. MB12-C1]